MGRRFGDVLTFQENRFSIAWRERIDVSWANVQSSDYHLIWEQEPWLLYYDEWNLFGQWNTKSRYGEWDGFPRSTWLLGTPGGTIKSEGMLTHVHVIFELSGTFSITDGRMELLHEDGTIAGIAELRYTENTIDIGSHRFYRQ